MMKCDRCRGTGVSPIEARYACALCLGTGEVKPDEDTERPKMNQAVLLCMNRKGERVQQDVIDVPDDAEIGQVTFQRARQRHDPMRPPADSVSPEQVEAMRWLAEQGEDPISQRKLVEAVEQARPKLVGDGRAVWGLTRAEFVTSLLWPACRQKRRVEDRDPTEDDDDELENARPLGGLSNAETHELLSAITAAITALRSPTAAWPDDARRVASELERFVK